MGLLGLNLRPVLRLRCGLTNGTEGLTTVGTGMFGIGMVGFGCSGGGWSVPVTPPVVGMIGMVGFGCGCGWSVPVTSVVCITSGFSSITGVGWRGGT